MFGFNKLTVSTQKVEIENLKRDKARLEKDVAHHEARCEELASMINNNVASSDVHFDFKSMRTFSVERNVHNGKPCTIVGYLLQEPVLSSDGEMVVMKDVVREWYLYCNQERHQHLVEQFRKVNK